MIAVLLPTRPGAARFRVQVKGILAAPPKATATPGIRGLIAGLIKGNQGLIDPQKKAGDFLGVNVGLGGGPARIPMIKGSELGGSDFPIYLVKFAKATEKNKPQI